MSTCTTEAGKKYRELKTMENDGMLLSPEEAEFLNQVEEVASLDKSVDHIQSAMITLDMNSLGTLNENEPTWRGNRVRIVSVNTDAHGRGEATIRWTGMPLDKVKHVKLEDIEFKTPLKKIMGSDPRSDTDGDYTTVLERAKVQSVESLLEVFDKVVELDGQKEDPAHQEYLRGLVKNLVGPTARAVSEMAVQLDAAVVENSGSFDPSENTIFVQVNKNSSVYGTEMSASEVYTHELIHAATHYAFSQKGNPKLSLLKKRLSKLRDETMKILTVDDLMPDVVVNEKIERQIAQDRFDYINENLEEFLAYAITHKKVKDKVSMVTVEQDKRPSNLLGSIVYYLKKLVDAVLMQRRDEDQTRSGDVAAAQLLHSLVNAQDRMNQKYDPSIASKVNDQIDFIEDYIQDKQNEWASQMKDKWLKGGYPIEGTYAQKAKWTLQGLGYALVDPEANGSLEQVLTAFGMKPEGTIQTLIKTIKKSDKMSNIAQKLGLMSVQVDETRETIARQGAHLINTLFDNSLSSTDKTALQAGILMSDAGIILDKYGEEGLDFFNDEAKRENKIAELQKKLEDASTEREMNFYNYQIAGLVEFMMTGKDSEVQLKNAYAIARLLGTAEMRKKPKKAVQELIDEIVSLKAMGKVEDSVKQRIEEIRVDYPLGLVDLGKHHKSTQFYLDATKSDQELANSKKGYFRETYDDYVTSMIAPISRKQELLDQGYVAEKRVKTSQYDALSDEMWLFVSRDMIRQPFNKSAVRSLGQDQDGLSMREMAYQSNNESSIKRTQKAIINTAKQTELINELIMDGKDPSKHIEGVISPQFREDGLVGDYRYTRSLEDKMLVGLEMDAPIAIGRSWSHQRDIEESKQLNEIVWQELLKDMAQHKGFGTISKLGYEYVPISIYSDNELIRDIARIMPKSFKDNLRLLGSARVDSEGRISKELAISMMGEDSWWQLSDGQQNNVRKQLAEGKLWVRRDMLIPMFGFRDLSAINPAVKKYLPKLLSTLLKRMENFWKEFVHLYKVDIVIKTLSVIVDNVISNFLIPVMQGANPKDVFDAQVTAWGQLTRYKEIQDELARLQISYSRDNDPKTAQKIRRLESEVNEMDIKPLIDAGLYTQIMEDLGEKDFKSSNRIAAWIDGKTENWPEVVRRGSHYLYVTEKSKLFQIVHEATAKSDFVARYSQYVFLKEKARKKALREKTKVTPAELAKIDEGILEEVRDTYINYTRPDSPFWQYLNDMGFVMFTKYGLRIQRIAANLVTGHPVRFAASLLGQEMLESTVGLDLDDVAEKSIFAKGPMNLLFSPSVEDMVKSVIEPQLYTDIKGIYSTLT